MNHAIRSMRNLPTRVFLSPQNKLARITSGVHFRQAATMAGKPEKNKDNAKENLNEKTRDVMSHSFGEGYATRSDEEGFGGIYGGNQSIPKVDIDRKIHETNPAYDKTQGNEVKEKEKARFQTNAVLINE